MTARAELGEVLRLGELATPGEWQRSGIRSPSPSYKGHAIGPDGNTVVVIPYDERHHTECLATADLLCAAVNFIRTHGPALLAQMEDNQEKGNA